jgi:hypothetical protein
MTSTNGTKPAKLANTVPGTPAAPAAAITITD